ncbi:hypothetical protein FC52_GL001006 [Lactobacillus pasteurii DSM 23907 = CRBIP 24.76]|uniref:Uncharacterized protein n=1 Tax=Lactobacillus pasteurii DSM 23907 = CRBIP 24.76 TaxID=1423790 RepID=I7JXU1_9LACO|nr:hypothetical protein [Lactobacillus pasteurii]KRK08269.1 hypothetical protein FC52_GL001006 [Lactobacillus pasteurii DSM 23907 = CRBIP 24.76]TDG77390.1 hypothetical protein C5L33_000833 [Lactobacillus pasteurii]CCI84935.1 Putative uncharacterized protein [Lactobacillus pasteurii DSM 23907 = CRBIP 24.76]
MSKKPSDLFSNTIGDKIAHPQQELNLASIQENIRQLTKDYPLSPGGEFGKAGKSSGVRVIEANDQFKTAQDFWLKLSKGGEELYLPNKKGKKVIFPDGSISTYRIITSTKNSPAIEIYVYHNNSKIKMKKIHFVRKD